MKKIQLLFVCFLCLLVFTSCAESSLEEAMTFFEKHENDLNIVAEYLAAYDYDDISISDSKGTMSLLLSKTVEISDPDVSKAIKALFSAGCYSITKDVESNCISFTIWGRFRDFYAGVHYSLDGVNVPTEQYLTKQESLGTYRWYYFEEDYNEWRTSHSS